MRKILLIVKCYPLTRKTGKVALRSESVAESGSRPVVTSEMGTNMA